MIAGLQETVARLVAESEIRRVIHRYARGCDRQDMDLIRSCYHPGAIERHGRYEGDVGGFVTWLEEVLPPFDSTTHFIGNVLIEVDGDTAWAESYCLGFHRTLAEDGERPVDRVANVRYLDRFELRDGAWLIAARDCIFQPGRVDVVGVDYPIADAAIRARSDRDDQSYRGAGR